MVDRRVVITGVGAVSPVGNTVQEMWGNLCAGQSGIGPITQFDAAEYDSRIAGEVRGFHATDFVTPKEARRMERFVQFAVAAAQMASCDAGLDVSQEDPYRVGVLVGSGIGSLHIIEQQHSVLLARGPKRITPFLIPMLIVNMAPGQIAIQLGVKGPNACTATACASGTHAIGDAFRIIQHGDAEMMICGGTESAITPLGVGGFCSLMALSKRNDAPTQASRPFDAERDGFVIGEGCGLVMLEELDHATARGAKIYAEVVGYGMTSDAHHMTAPAPDGSGAAHSMMIAMKNAGLQASDVSYINAHGTSTHLNDKTETMAIKTALGAAAHSVAVSSTKSMTGHLLGAAGGVEAVICAKAIEAQIAPPTTNYEHPDPECDLDYVPNTARQMPIRVALSNSLGFGGHNATLAFRQFSG
jgi:3-oxoacyl-[acyl-carrier-protein] synthase II